MKTVTLNLDSQGTFRLGRKNVGKLFPFREGLAVNLYLPGRTLSACALTTAALYADLAKRGVKIVEEQV